MFRRECFFLYYQLLAFSDVCPLFVLLPFLSLSTQSFLFYFVFVALFLDRNTDDRVLYEPVCGDNVDFHTSSRSPNRVRFKNARESHKFLFALLIVERDVAASSSSRQYAAVNIRPKDLLGNGFDPQTAVSFVPIRLWSSRPFEILIIPCAVSYPHSLNQDIIFLVVIACCCCEHRLSCLVKTPYFCLHLLFQFWVKTPFVDIDNSFFPVAHLHRSQMF